MVKVYFRLRRGWKRLNKVAQQQVKEYLLSQRRADGYLNAGGQVDAYYTQFGKLLECIVNSQFSILNSQTKPLVVKESMGRDTIYGQFFDFLSGDSKLIHKTAAILQRSEAFLSCKRPEVGRPSPTLQSLEASPTIDLQRLTSTAVCCVLAMQHQLGEAVDTSLVSWLKERQDETGGFRAS